jgi:hypothetical protein
MTSLRIINCKKKTKNSNIEYLFFIFDALHEATTFFSGYSGPIFGYVALG